MTRFLFLFLCLTLMPAALFAQEDKSFDKVWNACLSMQEAIANNDNNALRTAAGQLEAAGTSSFDSLTSKDDSIASLNGHFVFDYEFANIIADGDDALSIADSLSYIYSFRSPSRSGGISTKTCLVKAGQSTKYSFVARGPQRLGIVTEPGGRVAVRIHVTNRSGLSEWHNDNKNAKRGTNRFRTAFNLPSNKANKVELEVINRGKKNVSFVVISN